MSRSDHLRAAHFWLAIVIAGLVVSGVTAFPLESEVGWLHSALQRGPVQSFAEAIHLLPWIAKVHVGRA